MTRRQLLRQYLLSLTVLFCIFILFCGIITVRERTEYNMSLTPYSQLSLENEGDYIKIKLEERELVFEKAQLKKALKGRTYSLLGEFFEYLGSFFEKNVN